MIDTILIANRGEIACRVIKTARRMGIRSVTVYSDADADAMHVRMADAAVHIGPSPTTESYLVGERIIEAALATGAQAIHPGYGFLSENAEFVDAVKAAGLIFIGPSATSIRAMGLKDAAKALMQDAGVPVVPGYHGENQDDAFLASEAERIGYPIMIKARAGGGGKGMRFVETPDDFDDALQSCRREAQSSFGDPMVLIEKFITAPRHIEVQVFGDTHGNAVHLYERDCSLQRRHQKVIEEAPAPDMSEAVRTAMTSAAIKAVHAIDYVGAGTIEFIVDGSGDLREDGFWFMEMNTRLQVEHPVTEAVTGLDLVEWQIRVAQGEPLPRRQDEITLSGHAMEARVYAEDPVSGFLPSTGTLEALSFGPARIDTGVASGDAVSPFYDPMIAKVISFGETRDEARKTLISALSQTVISGLKTNVDFLTSLAKDTDFCAGTPDTGLIERRGAALTKPDVEEELFDALASCLAYLGSASDGRQSHWRLWNTAAKRMCLTRADGSRLMCQVNVFGQSGFRVASDDWDIDLGEMQLNDDRLVFSKDGVRQTAYIWRIATAFGTLFAVGWKDATRLYRLADPLDIDAAYEASGDDVAAPMTGLLKIVEVSVGDTVEAGQPLGVMEAMKMEHTMTAPRDGEIAAVECAAGDQVEGGAILFRLAPVQG